MSRSSVLILLGVLTMLAPFSGLPSPLRTLLTVIFGASVLGMGVALRTREMRHRSPVATASPEPEHPPLPREISPI